MKFSGKLLFIESFGEASGGDLRRRLERRGRLQGVRRRPDRLHLQRRIGRRPKAEVRLQRLRLGQGRIHFQ